jgi:ferredoxin-type protein NapF
MAAGIALWPALPAWDTALYVTALSPFVAAFSLLAARAWPATAGLGLAIGLATLVRHRLFCRWLCPLGVCLEAAGGVGRRLGRPPWHGLRVGPWIVLLTAGGALLGYPFLLWLDPLAIFAGLFDALARAREPLAWFGALGFAGTMVLSLLWPGLWCVRLCPLGALQDLLMQARRFLRSRADWKTSGAAPRDGVPQPVRRALLGVAAGTILAETTRAIPRPAHPLRPPGARAEPQFTGLCTRCGNCLRACPSRIIRLDLGSSGLAGLLTPTLSFERDYCREDCVRCTHVCPSRALAPMPPEGKPQARIGRPQVDMSLCLLGNDRDCAACARWCPYGAIRYVFSEQEYTLRPQIDPDCCNGCGACQVACPTRPRKAIVIRAADHG